MNVATIIEFIESMVKSTAMTNNEGAYGGGMAGAPFDPISFIKKPQVILRVISLVILCSLFIDLKRNLNFKFKDILHNCICVYSH